MSRTRARQNSDRRQADEKVAGDQDRLPDFGLHQGEDDRDDDPRDKEHERERPAFFFGADDCAYRQHEGDQQKCRGEHVQRVARRRQGELRLESRRGDLLPGRVHRAEARFWHPEELSCSPLAGEHGKRHATKGGEHERRYDRAESFAVPHKSEELGRHDEDGYKAHVHGERDGSEVSGPGPSARGARRVPVDKDDECEERCRNEGDHHRVGAGVLAPVDKRQADCAEDARGEGDAGVEKPSQR